MAPWQERRAVWHRWFAWRPVNTPTGAAWFRSIWRRMTDITSWEASWEYATQLEQPADGERTWFLMKYGFSWDSLRRAIADPKSRKGPWRGTERCKDCGSDGGGDLIFLLNEEDTFRCAPCANTAKWGKPHPGGRTLQDW